MFMLKLKMWLLMSIFLGIIYAIITGIGLYLGVSNFYFYLFLSLAIMFLQYMIGPKIIEWTMKVKYVTRSEYPKLFAMVEELAQKAKIPVPKIGIAPIALPNAFAFGRGRSDGRVCVTEGIMRLLSEDELKAVIGHELSHIKNRDVLFITLLSVIPMILYRLAWGLMWSGGRRRSNGANTALIGLIAFLFYFITSMLVLYGSRIREYFADKGSIDLGNEPRSLATALYKLVYGSARIGKEPMREIEGVKAFFVNDPSRALTELKELSQLDMDRSGTIDKNELAMLEKTEIKLNFGDKLMEVLSTHPNMLKRIKRLSTY